jgi:predicted RNA binding protein YcfA (HicA-like mRNA interferase family)
VIHKLKAAGFVEVRAGKGSHLLLRHPEMTVHYPIVLETEESGAVRRFARS